MFPVLRSHRDYQSFVAEQLKTHYTGGILRVQPPDWNLIEKFWITDLNKRRLGQTKYKDDFSLSESGVPICNKGLEMKDNGYDHTRGRRKYRCPLVNKGVVTCDSPCSTSSYGRCIYTYTKENLRLFPPIARNSNEWKNAYKRRTTVERSNKREKVDYMLEAARHRSTKMWTIRIYGIMMCQHMDAWFKESDLKLQSTLLTA